MLHARILKVKAAQCGSRYFSKKTSGCDSTEITSCGAEEDFSFCPGPLHSHLRSSSHVSARHHAENVARCPRTPSTHANHIAEPVARANAHHWSFFSRHL